MKINNIADLSADLCQMYEDLRSGKMEAKEAIEANNTAGKIISAAKVQLAYHALRGESPSIPFLAAPTENKPDTPTTLGGVAISNFPTFPSASQLIAASNSPTKQKGLKDGR
jgi:hypothetical protein